jgi:hypothetical protein
MVGAMDAKLLSLSLARPRAPPRERGSAGSTALGGGLGEDATTFVHIRMDETSVYEYISGARGRGGVVQLKIEILFVGLQIDESFVLNFSETVFFFNTSRIS